MASSHEFEARDAAALILADAIDRQALAQVAACPAPDFTHCAAQQANARAAIGMADVFHMILAKVHETSGRTRH
jgi:hypothetical protein